MTPSSASIARHFANLKDPRRQHRQRHPLLSVVVTALCAVIAGADDWQEVEDFARLRLDWLRRFLDLPNGAPSHDTFERLFDRLDPRSFQRSLVNWLNAATAGLPVKHVAIDGKLLLSSGRPVRGIGMLTLVSAWAVDAGLSLGQVAVPEGSNEIPAIPRLLELLDIQGALVTVDAGGCQKAIAARVIEGGGDYVMTVKGNQGRLSEDIAECFAAAFDADMGGYEHDEYKTVEVNRGRKEERTYTMIYDPPGIRDEEKWAGLCAVGMCFSERTEGGVTTEELRYFIGSRRMSAREYGMALRGHWRIENNLHWQLDVTFGEDASRVSGRNGAENLSWLRKVALSLLKQHRAKKSINRKRYSAALDTSFLEEILDLSHTLGNV